MGYKSFKRSNLFACFNAFFLKKVSYLKVHRIEIHEHETKAPEYFNEGSLLKTMENPQNHIDLNDKKYAKHSNIRGIGTVATRADIIEKLFNMNALESRDGKIKVTSKGKQILELSPSELTCFLY